MNKSLPPLPQAAVEALGREFNRDPRVVQLFQQYMASVYYSRPFAFSLIDVGQGRCGDSWEVRRLAAFMLQQHLLSLRVEAVREFPVLFQRLGLVNDDDGNLPKGVLDEGYSRRDLLGFIREFRRRLTRPLCAFHPSNRGQVTAEFVREFAHLSRQECKLVLARYMFTAEEVVARTHRLVRPTEGLPVSRPANAPADVANEPGAGLPDYEASILRGLHSTQFVYWVADQTPSVLNSLVEYPLGTVVLVIKPPGSHHEFELKRAGRRGSHSLSVRSHVPPSHRLDGGSMISSLQWDVQATASLSHLYRLIHDEPAPVSRIVNIVGKYRVPVGDRDYPIVEYLTNRSLYGEGYAAMRSAMAIVVACFRQELGEVLPPIPGDYGLTAQFLAFAGPAQATVCGSSSFRLDLVARYLSGDGPDEHFGRGLKVTHQISDAKRLADVVLDEVLGVYLPPKANYRDHDQYIAAALEFPKNRARANTVYLSLLGQIGTMWGTLLGLRGYSYGESFVSRNVGIRTVWNRGGYRVRLVFQDHDNLALPSGSESEFHPVAALPPMMLDARYINGRAGDDRLEYEINSLNSIYRVDDTLREAGQTQLRRAMKSAYAKTQRIIRTDPQAKLGYQSRFIERLRDWDAVARIYLVRHGNSTPEVWKERVRKFLQARGYSGSSIADHCQALENYGSFVESYGFLYGTRTVAQSTTGAPRVAQSTR